MSDKPYYTEQDDITEYWDARYREWLARSPEPDWGVFATKDAWFEERFAHILPAGLEHSPTLSGVRGKELVGDHFVSGRVLELGCGNAMYSVPLLRRFSQYYGVDTSATALKIAGIYFNEVSKIGMQGRTLSLISTGKPLDFPDGFFDCVVTITVLQHQPLRLRQFYIGEIKRVLAPGGIYVGLEMAENSLAFDMPPMPRQDWIQAWQPLGITHDIPAEHPGWGADNVWVAR